MAAAARYPRDPSPPPPPSQPLRPALVPQHSRDDRIAKLRRMAEHPASNPHEAELARAEIERLQTK